MSRIYTDYLNETVLTIPDKFIDVKTGESQLISQGVQEQLEYHAENNTLIHLLLSALDEYLHPQTVQSAGSKEIMIELLEIKKMMQRGNLIKNEPRIDFLVNNKTPNSSELDLKDIEELLEAFGG
ncbi:hypothetical protein CIL05_05385 [Virgibacillus profundi]|uniref:Uncharacterized protein n=1 Tax=Virgibacillus profundi TaxID=2024555 RepID=A0A2A2IH07_9BACI|nr:hypothetical protein [Virgibacillus profundi]PAV30534.1 hypothetical protein CIL05_05385 [Virgibacillus profundi]PXY54706.1 hypothetical protein CIT14_05470 [Virgibacillus profundi]